MRLVVTLLVRDEADVLAATLEHHLAQGADHLVVTDNGSTDGTLDVLEDYRAAGVVDLLHEPDQTYRQAEWVTRMARIAHERHGADWVVNADADEFWLPLERTSTLAGCLAALDPDVVAVRAQRVNLVAPVLREGAWSEQLLLRDPHSLSERGTRIGPKVCHRGAPDVEVAQGNHSVSGGGPQGRTVEGQLEVLHVPVRSAQQFERKIVNGGSAYAANTDLPAEVGWHWRADHARHLAGTLGAEVGRRMAAAAAGEGVTPDTWLRDSLRARVATAVRPDRLRDVLRRDGS